MACADDQPPKNDSPIDCHLEITRAKNNTVAILKFTNKGKTPYPYLRWNLIKDGELTFDAFDMKQNGASIQYKGERVKRRAPTRGDYELLEPMKEIKTEVVLNRFYDLADGKYEISYFAISPHMDDPSKLDFVTSNEVHFEIVHGSLKK